MIPELTLSEYIRIAVGSFLIGAAASIPLYASTHSYETAGIGFLSFFIAALLNAFGLVAPTLNGAMNRSLNLSALKKRSK